ncbi:NACHT domain-containing protein [Paraburkholderia sp. RL18-101-BIB-B]|uniref:NACHT domain-containing protein n=1 Tax=Paraburkholderia sp. RL18-101-BIB-B TaxID=3031634 RepID=UPI0038BA0DB6
MSTNETISAVTAPAGEIPAFIPVTTAAQSLPFESLSWQNFEKLCYRLAGKDADIETHSLYGRAGQAQEGIDIFARKVNGRYNTWQAKKYKNYTVANLNKAVEAFVSGSWASRTENFYIAVQCAVDDVPLQDAIEAHAGALRQQNIVLRVLGGDDLSTSLRPYPEIVLEFFGRCCAKDFYGDSIENNVLERLDGSDVSKIRNQLQKVYSAGFQLLDRIAVDTAAPLSSAQAAAFPLVQRFSMPDVLVRETVVTQVSKDADLKVIDAVSSNRPTMNEMAAADRLEVRRVNRLSRIPVSQWLSAGDGFAILGDAGSGKSTILRCLALDILTGQEIFPEVAKKLGRQIPIFVSFAKWVRITQTKGTAVGLKEIIRESLQQQLTADLVGLLDRAVDERRIILLVDGLDEWANEQAARTTLQHLLTLSIAHEIPTVVTARPRGLARIGTIPKDWATSSIAPLSSIQQRGIVSAWFGRSANVDEDKAASESTVGWRTERFFRELRKGRGLETLAETPLMLLALIALAIRRQVLPLNKVQALGQLTDVLLDIHPQTRATAAGDIESRFSAAATSEVRKDSLGALAFAIRSEGADAGYSLKAARQQIKKFLSDPDGYAFSVEQALSVTNEILAVNAETVGLLVEKGPEEIGFVHASIEEYLASVHIHSWPLDSILIFVGRNAGSIRWRSVLTDLIVSTKRRTETEAIISAIEAATTDTLGSIQRRILLSEVAFGPAEIHRTTAQRLADKSIAIIESSGWETERRAHLSAFLEGIHNPTLSQDIVYRMQEWGMRSEDYLSSFYRVAIRWPNESYRLKVIQKGFVDERYHNRRAAKEALVEIYAGSKEVENWLVSLLQSAMDLSVVAFALEALVEGWPDNSEIPVFIEQAMSCAHNEVQLSAMFAKVKRATADDEDLSRMLALAHSHSDLDYECRGMAAHVLLLGWKDHPTVVDKCVRSADDRHNRREEEIQNSIAWSYLLGCSETNERITALILRNFEEKRPFTLGLPGDWSPLMRFVRANSDVREGVVTSILRGGAEHQEYKIYPILVSLLDDRLKAYCLDNARTAHDFGIFWYVAPLLNGWPSDDPDICSLKLEIDTWTAERKNQLISLFPKLMSSESCRAELIRITREDGKARLDLLVKAFATLGLTDDEEVAELLLTRIEQSSDGVFSAAGEFIASFQKHPKVRQFALTMLRSKREIPVAAIAHIQDTNIQQELCRRLMPLGPLSRQMILDASTNEFDRNEQLRDLLSRYDWEEDCDLKVQYAVHYFEAIRSSGEDIRPHVERLLDDSIATGPDHDKRRAAAFAGLLSLGAIERFVPLQWANKPLGVALGAYGSESQTLLKLIAKNWSYLTEVFEGKLIDRIAADGVGRDFWAAISAYLPDDDLLRSTFVQHCTNEAVAVDAGLLRAISKEVPRSDLLREYCMRAIMGEGGVRPNRNWHEMQLYFEASQILRDHFKGDLTITAELEALVKRSGRTSGVVPLVLFDPKSEVLRDLVAYLEKAGDDLDAHYSSVVIAAELCDTATFIRIVRAMVNRDFHSMWDFQEWCNQAVRSRLLRDEAAVQEFRKIVCDGATENELATLPRYLADTGNLDEETVTVCRNIVNERMRGKGVAPSGYDGVADSIRPTIYSLLDVLTGPVG